MYFIYLLVAVFSEIYARFYGPFNADKAVVVLYSLLPYTGRMCNAIASFASMAL